jgi:hypothetical protein
LVLGLGRQPKSDASTRYSHRFLVFDSNFKDPKSKTNYPK